METATLNNPSSPESEQTQEFNPRVAFDFENLTRLREFQGSLYEEAYDASKSEGFGEPLREFFAKKSVEDGVSAYLNDHGMDVKNPDYKKYKNGILELSILNVDNINWNMGVDLDANGQPVQSGYERSIELYENLTGKTYTHIAETTSPTLEDEVQDESPETDPLIEAQKAELKQLRTKVAELSAKRQGRLWGHGGEEYEEALRAYNGKVVLLGKLVNEDVIADQTLDVTQKNKIIIDYLVEEQGVLREESLKNVEGTKLHGFIKKFAKMMDADTNKGRIAKSVALGAGLAGVGLAAGAAVGAVAAAAGVGVLVASTAVAATGLATGVGAKGVKLAQVFAMREAKVGRGLQQLTEKDIKSIEKPDLNESIFNINDAKPPTGVEEIQARLDQMFEDDITQEQDKRRKSVKIAMGTVALSAVVGGAVGSLLTNADLVKDVAHEVKNFLSAPLFEDVKGFFTGLGQPDAAPAPDQTYGPDAPDPEVDGGEDIDNGTGDAGNDNGSEGGSYDAPAAPEFVSDPRFDVPDGKGGIWLFQEAGLTESDWYSVQDELASKFPDEFEFKGDDLRIVKEGPLSEAAQEFIKSHFHMA